MKVLVGLWRWPGAKAAIASPSQQGIRWRLKTGPPRPGDPRVGPLAASETMKCLRVFSRLDRSGMSGKGASSPPDLPLGAAELLSSRRPRGRRLRQGFGRSRPGRPFSRWPVKPILSAPERPSCRAHAGADASEPTRGLVTISRVPNPKENWSMRTDPGSR